MRIDSEYSEEVYSIFEDEKFPYKSDIAFGEIIEKSTLKEKADVGVDNYIYMICENNRFIG